MAINYRKLKSQIHPYHKDGVNGYIFIPTEAQKEQDVATVVIVGSKRRALRVLTFFIYLDHDDITYKEFAL